MSASEKPSLPWSYSVLPDGAKVERLDYRSKGERVHLAVNRVLATVALLLAIVLMLGLLYAAHRVQQAGSEIGDAFDTSDTSEPAYDEPPYDDPSWYGEVIDECWTADDGDELCAPGGRDGILDGVPDGE